MFFNMKLIIYQGLLIGGTLSSRATIAIVKQKHMFAYSPADEPHGRAVA
jgi:hypothetical protein